MHGPAAAPLMAFAGSPLDRADHIRVDDEALAAPLALAIDVDDATPTADAPPTDSAS